MGCEGRYEGWGLGVRREESWTGLLTIRAISFSDMAGYFICSNSSLLVLWTTTTFSASLTLAAVCILLFQLPLGPILTLARLHSGHRDKTRQLLIAQECHAH